jgi:hypothetical protein
LKYSLIRALSSQTEHNPLILCYNSASSLFTQLTMPRFEVKQSAKLNLTSYSGLALIGQCCQAAQVEAVIDPKLPVSQGMKTSDLVKAMVGLLSLGKSDFEAIEPFLGRIASSRKHWGCRKCPPAPGYGSGSMPRPASCGR